MPEALLPGAESAYQVKRSLAKNVIPVAVGSDTAAFPLPPLTVPPKGG